MLVKLGKQIKMPENTRFIAKYGTINAINPQAIFVSIHSWATPKHNLRFKRKLQTLTQTVKKQVDKSVDFNVFNSRYIVDFDLRESGLMKDKPSFMAVEITLFPKTILKFPNDIYNQSIHNLISEVTEEIQKNRHFSFSAKKEK